jgi:hypothetical protein
MLVSKVYLKFAQVVGLAFMGWATLHSLPNSAHANSFEYDSWRALTVHERQLYVLGVFDQMRTSFSRDPEAQATAQGLSDCVDKVGLTSRMLTQYVDLHYAQSEQRGSQSVIMAMHYAIVRGACLSFVNARRTDNKLSSWHAYVALAVQTR